MSATAFFLLQQVSQSVPRLMSTAGLGARRIAELGWAMIVVATVVVVVVCVLLLIPVFRSRGVDPATPAHGRTVIDERRYERDWILVGGTAVPALILGAFFVYTLITLHALDGRARQSAMTVEVIGHQWWWEIRYPDQRIITANELHLPVGKPIRLLLHSDDVIHSFWVPQLQGKTDLVPGRTNGMWIQADSAGVYRGECAEYCGAQHAHMAFVVVAQPQGAFDAWLAHEAEPAGEPSDSSGLAGQQLFLTSGCQYCHTVRGTPAGGTVGPDLTHLGTRTTLAAGSFDNVRGTLAGWIMNPDVLKPGVRMPPTPLTGEQLQALLTYLEGLK